MNLAPTHESGRSKCTPCSGNWRAVYLGSGRLVDGYLVHGCTLFLRFRPIVIEFETFGRPTAVYATLTRCVVRHAAPRLSTGLCTMTELMGVAKAADPQAALTAVLGSNEPCGKCIRACLYLSSSADDRTPCLLRCTGCEEIRLDVGPNSDPVRMCALYASGQESKGSLFPPETISGEIVMADPIVGCEDLVNAKAVSGKFVVLDRGACTFDIKVANALKAGAAAVIIVNNEPTGIIRLGGPKVQRCPTLRQTSACA